MGEQDGLGTSTGEAAELENASEPWPSWECAWPWASRFSPLCLSEVLPAHLHSALAELFVAGAL